MKETRVTKELFLRHCVGITAALVVIALAGLFWADPLGAGAPKSNYKPPPMTEQQRVRALGDCVAAAKDWYSVGACGREYPDDETVLQERFEAIGKELNP